MFVIFKLFLLCENDILVIFFIVYRRKSFINFEGYEMVCKFYFLVVNFFDFV